MPPRDAAEVAESETERDPHWFDPIEKMVRPVVRHMARAYARAGAGEEDDLFQEGLITLSAAFARFDGGRANARTYARGVLSRKYNNALRDAKRQKRAPRVWEQSEKGWKLVPCRTVSLEGLAGNAVTAGYWEGSEVGRRRFGGGQFTAPVDERPGPEAEAVEEIDQSEAIRDVMACLTPFQEKVFRLYLAPSAGLLATAWNLSGNYTVQIRHLAIYLGVPASRVEVALREIRAIVSSLDAGAVEES